MKLSGVGTLLRIFIGEADLVGHKQLYEVIVRKARESGLSGATVIRGVESFGAKSAIHTAKILRLSEDLPIVIEIVDTAERIASFLEVVDEIMGQAKCGGLVTTEKVQIIRYTSDFST